MTLEDFASQCDKLIDWLESEEGRKGGWIKVSISDLSSKNKGAESNRDQFVRRVDKLLNFATEFDQGPLPSCLGPKETRSILRRSDAVLFVKQFRQWANAQLNLIGAKEKSDLKRKRKSVRSNDEKIISALVYLHGSSPNSGPFTYKEISKAAGTDPQGHRTLIL